MTASGVLECITDEMDLVHRVTDYPWRLRIHPDTLQFLRESDAARPEGGKSLFYRRNGEEFIRAVDNEAIPFRLHYRVVPDDSLDPSASYGTEVEMDDEAEPGVKERSERDWAQMRELRRKKIAESIEKGLPLSRMRF